MTTGIAVIKKTTLDKALEKAKRKPGRYEGAFMPGEWVRMKANVDRNNEMFVDARIVSVTWLHNADVPVYSVALPIEGCPELLARTEARIPHPWLVHKDAPNLKLIT